MSPGAAGAGHDSPIAGTCRASTGFLVRWLAAAGLRTHIAAHDTSMWDDDANAGLEDLPVVLRLGAAALVIWATAVIVLRIQTAGTF